METEGKAALLWLNAYLAKRHDAKLSDIQPNLHLVPNQSLPKCPECDSVKVYKDGIRELRTGNLSQRFLCRSCGYRFSEFKVKLNVTRKVEVPHSAPELFENRVVPGKLPSKEPLNGLPLSACEDVASNHRVTAVGKGLNAFAYTRCKRQVYAILQEAKNLNTATEAKTVVGEASTLDPRITQYEWKCKKRGLKQNTVDLRKYHLNKLVNDGADLSSPDSVETVLATKDYPTATKWLVVNAYRSYTKMFNIQWEPIR
jgi:hypothetical protein